MKKFLTVLLVVVMVLGTLTGCAQLEGILAGMLPEAHAHEYSKDWSSDETNHWHKATCNVEDEGCDKAVTGLAPHYDVDNNGACDVCDYDADHEHGYVSDWSFDSENHWNVSNCGHAVVNNKAAHTPDVAGVCTVCAYGSDSITVENAVALGAAGASGVTGGTISWISDPGMGYINEGEVVYQLGENLLYYVDEYENAYWLSNVDGKIHAVQVAGEFIYKPYLEYTEDSVNGCEFAIVPSELVFYGAEGLVSGLYEAASANTNKDFVEYSTIVDGVVVYAYSFGYYSANNEAFYVIAVSFTLGDDYAINNLSLVVEEYTYVYDEWSGFYYGYEGVDEDGDEVVDYYKTTWLIPSTKKITTVEQTLGEQNLENPYKYEDCIASSYKIVDDFGNELGATIDLVAGDYVSYSFAEVDSATADMTFDEVVVTLTKDGEYVDSSAFYASASWDGNGIVLSPKAAGTYVVSVDTLATEPKEYTVNVTLPETISLNATISGSDASDSNNIYTSVEYVIGAYANGDSEGYADASFTAAFLGSPLATLNDNGDGTYTVKAVGECEITLVLTSVANPGVSTTVVLNASTPPSIAEIYNGEYTGSLNMMGNKFDITFTPASEGALEGTAVWETDAWDYASWSNVDITVNLTYSVDEDGVVTFTFVDSTSESITADSIGGDYGMKVICENYVLIGSFQGDTANLTQSSADGADEDPLLQFIDKSYTDGYYYINFTTYDDGETINVTFMDVPMGRPTWACNYILTGLGEADNWGDQEMTFVVDGEPFGEVPYDLAEVIVLYNDGLIAVFTDGMNNPPVYFE